MPQHQILAIIGEPAGIGALEKCLNRFDNTEANKQWWSGYAVEISGEFLKEKTNFAVFLKEFGEPTHAVFVRKIKNGRFVINDTYDQSYYEMTEDEFLKVWTGAYIYYGEEDK